MKKERNRWKIVESGGESTAADVWTGRSDVIKVWKVQRKNINEGKSRLYSWPAHITKKEISLYYTELHRMVMRWLTSFCQTYYIWYFGFRFKRCFINTKVVVGIIQCENVTDNYFLGLESHRLKTTTEGGVKVSQAFPGTQLYADTNKAPLWPPREATQSTTPHWGSFGQRTWTGKTCVTENLKDHSNRDQAGLCFRFHTCTCECIFLSPLQVWGVDEGRPGGHDEDMNSWTCLRPAGQLCPSLKPNLPLRAAAYLRGESSHVVFFPFFPLHQQECASFCSSLCLPLESH